MAVPQDALVHLPLRLDVMQCGFDVGTILGEGARFDMGVMHRVVEEIELAADAHRSVR